MNKNHISLVYNPEISFIAGSINFINVDIIFIECRYFLLSIKRIKLFFMIFALCIINDKTLHRFEWKSIKLRLQSSDCKLLVLLNPFGVQ